MQIKDISMQKIIVTVLFLSFSTFAWGDISESRELHLDATGLSVLRVDTGAGSLDIRGVPGANSIDVKAIIEVDTSSDKKAKKILESDVTLTLERDGDKAVLKAASDAHSFFGGSNVMINLEITTPENMNLDIDDGSGSIDVQSIVGNVAIDDGSGSIDMQSIGGNVVIDDGSGSITIRDIGGDLAIDDGSGGIDIEMVNGEVNVDDGSGSLDIRNIGGTVFIRDGSGGISVNDLKSDLIIRESGSGSLVINGVKGSITTDE